MNIWLFKIHEPIPSDGENVRLYRMGVLANYLSQDTDLNITWFNSRVDHNKKSLRKISGTQIVKPNYKIELLDCREYKSSFSYGRFQSEEDTAESFLKYSASLNKEDFPEVIVTAMPSLSLAYEVVSFAKKNDIPVIVDLRDMWPDIWCDKLFPWWRGLGEFVFKKQFKKMEYICGNVDGIWGITEGFLNWGLGYAKRSRNSLDSVFHLISKYDQSLESVPEEFQAEVDSLIQNKTVFVYGGTISKSFDFDFILREINSTNRDDFIFLVAGDGDYFDEFSKKVEGNKKIKMFGRVDQEKLKFLYSKGSFGVAPYINRKDFQLSIPNKIIEYLANSLPILHSLSGEAHELIQKNNCGFKFNLTEPGSLASIIEKSVESPELQHNSIEAFNANFCFEKTYDGMQKSIMTAAKKSCHSVEKNP